MRYLRELITSSHCVDCGEARLVVLDYDHVGTKAWNVTELARRGCSLRRLEAEVAECVVRCANCHRRRTLASADAVAAYSEGEPRTQADGGAGEYRYGRIEAA